MVRNVVFAVMAVLLTVFICGLIVAFALSSEGDKDDQETRIVTTTPNTTPTILYPTIASPVGVTVIPATPIVVVPPASNNVVVATTAPLVQTTCTTPAGWQPYIVAAGDTLGIIAVIIDSTIEELVAGNCLSNPDAIFVGQQIYLPSLPPAVNAGGATAAGTNPYVLLVQPNIGFSNNTYTLTAGTTTTISWGNLPAAAIAVDFYWTPPNATAPTLLARDSNLADGANTTWVVPVGAAGSLTATAFLQDGSQLPSTPMTIISR